MFRDLIRFADKWKKVFFADLVAGCIVYSLLMVNQLVNQLDGMWHGSISYASTHEVGIGRWLWPLLDKGRGYLSPDPVTSIISLSLFSLAFIFVLEVIEIKQGLTVYLGSFIFVINTSVLMSLSYRYMSPTFAFSCFFSALAGYIVVKSDYKNRSGQILSTVFAAVFISFMMGLYQANLGCTCLIILLFVMIHLYKGDRTYRELGQTLLRAVAAIIAGSALYLLMVQLTLRIYDTSMSSYGGAADYGVLETILHFFERFPDTYRYFVICHENTGIKISYFSGKIYIAVYLLLVLCFLGAAIRLAKTDKVRAVLFAVCLLLIPVACNAIYFIAFESEPQIQMMLPICMCLPALALICTGYAGEALPKWSKTILVLMMLVVLFGNYIMTIYDQQAMYMGRNSLRELGSEIVTELIRDDLYHPYYNYVFVGRPADSPVFAKNDVVFARANRIAAVGTWTADDLKWATQSWQGFWEHEMGNRLQVAGTEALDAALSNEYVKNMPVFPEKGSCALVDGVVVVKLAPVE